MRGNHSNSTRSKRALYMLQARRADKVVRGNENGRQVFGTVIRSVCYGLSAALAQG
jgi:hypothetical protein